MVLNKNAARSLSPHATALANTYEDYSQVVSDLVAAMRGNNEQFQKQSDMTDISQWKTAELLTRQADIVESIIPQLEIIEDEINALTLGGAMTEELTPIPPTLPSPYKR